MFQARAAGSWRRCVQHPEKSSFALDPGRWRLVLPRRPPDSVEVILASWQARHSLRFCHWRTAAQQWRRPRRPLGTNATFGVVDSTYTNTQPGMTITGDLCYTTAPARNPTLNGALTVPCNAQQGTDETTAKANMNAQNLYRDRCCRCSRHHRRWD
jgi:hypothetical protein